MEYVQLNNQRMFFGRNDSLFYIRIINSIKKYGE